MADTNDGGSGWRLDRRSVLKIASTAGIGAAAGVGRTSADPVTGRRFFGECGENWDRAPVEYPFVDLRTPEPTTWGDFPAGASEIAVYVHGWLEKAARNGRSQGHTLETAFEQNDYTEPTIAAVWNSNQPAWEAAKYHADIAGERLADWLGDYLGTYPDTTVRIVPHSLGTRVTLEALAVLDGVEVVDTVSPIGGAVNPETVCDGTRYASGIESSAGEVYNYHSENDEVVCEYYALAESTPGIGCAGADCGGAVPDNYADEDVTDSVGRHCDYGKPDVGCVPEIVQYY